MRLILLAVSILFLSTSAPAQDKKSPRDALQAFNDVIGTWRGTGTPAGTREEQQQGFWLETMTWQWRFQDNDAWIDIAFDKGKHLSSAILRYVPEKDRFALSIQTTTKEKLVFTGTLNNKVLTLDRATDNQAERLVFTFLHANRFLYRHELRPANRTSFTRMYNVGATKEGVPFANGGIQPECIVSGGLGTSTVMYQGKTYYVCCGGCRDEFNENPEKYIKEYEARKKSR